VKTLHPKDRGETFKRLEFVEIDSNRGGYTSTVTLFGDRKDSTQRRHNMMHGIYVFIFTLRLTNPRSLSNMQKQVGGDGDGPRWLILVRFLFQCMHLQERSILPCCTQDQMLTHFSGFGSEG
jgi:hypothetical protein